jgi:iron(II)-dependent oxidoreductase
VAAGLDASPRRLDAQYLYDAQGSALFGRITEQPEYYLTRTEARLLAAGAPAIRRVAGAGTLVELGSGAAEKTRFLLDAWCAAGPAAYVPIDVDQQGLEEACRTLRGRYPSLKMEGLVASFERALPLLRGSSPLTVVFLGSTLGNLGWREYPQFCDSVATALSDGDHFLTGVDLVKPTAALEAAYNDAAGVSEAFTRNLFARMNRELQTDVSADAVSHVAYYDADRERMEIFAEARREILIRIPALGREFRIARGERILTEQSYKFRPEALAATVERCGFRLVWSDEGEGEGKGQFGLFLFRRVRRSSDRSSSGKPDLRAPRAQLAETRARTLEIVAPLSEKDLLRQHDVLMSPIAWDLGHIAHFEERWLLGPLERRERTERTDDDALYDPLATPRAHRAELLLPPLAVTRARLRDVRRRIEDRLEDRLTTPIAKPVSPLLEGGLALHLVEQHEAQHQETIFQAIALREDLEYRPSFVVEAPALPDTRPVTDAVLIPGGPFIMGTDERSAVYDNERPAHEVNVPAFRIDRALVTNGRYLAFIDDGGYARRELWGEAGWKWLRDVAAQAPAHWRKPPRGSAATGPARSFEAVVFGRVTPLQPDAPVVHVSWYEADAFARWAGGRLPTEAEWEKAALWDPARGSARRHPWGNEPWDPTRANLDQHRLEPSPAGAHPEGRSAYGCLQMLGDVWEWTSTWFDGYPGFRSFPYKEYSEIFFGKSYRVLRGGSFVTRASVARGTFRNWDLPERRQIFSGLRCVRDA